MVARNEKFKAKTFMQWYKKCAPMQRRAQKAERFEDRNGRAICFETKLAKNSFVEKQTIRIHIRMRMSKPRADMKKLIILMMMTGPVPDRLKIYRQRLLTWPERSCKCDIPEINLFT